MSGAAGIDRDIADAVAAATHEAPSLAALGDALVGALGGRIPFDRLNIGLIDAGRWEFHDAYVFGHNVAGRATGHVRTLHGSVVEAAIRAGDGFCFRSSERAQWLERFPHFGPVLESGIRAMLAVPVRDEGRVVAALVLAAHASDAWTDATLAAAQAAARGMRGPLLALARSPGDRPAGSV